MSQSNQDILAKPSGISLAEHTQHVKQEAAYIIEQLPFLSVKYQRLCARELGKDLRIAAHYHDWGKSFPQWQEPCQRDYKVYLNWRKREGLSISDLNAEDYRRFEVSMRKAGKMPGQNIFHACLRHELASLLYIDQGQVALSEPIMAAIAAHHGKLSYRHKHRWKKDGRNSDHEPRGPFAKYWEDFEALTDDVSDESLAEVVKKRYEFAAIRALLQLADTRASRKEGEGEDAHYELASFPKVKRFPTLRPVQKAALGLAEQPVGILRAPTGSGKTYAALLWAEEQVVQSKADRLVIAMPTRFTSNALSIGAAEQLGETGLYHSSAWYNRYGELKKGAAYKEAMESHRMAKFLATPVTVCTIDHLLIALTGTREAHHSTFYFLANSAVVFDEADFYDPFVQANIVVLLEILKVLEVPVLIMSATVPDSAKKHYQATAPIAVAETESRSTRKKLHFIGSSVLQKEAILREMISREEGVIYANTIARALEYYRWFEDNMEEKNIPIVIYHSRFTEEGKKGIEDNLINKLGKEAWENNERERVRGIAIMTQIGEMSVNISTTLMLTDLCPWDRLAQRVGRLARFEFQDEGICYVVTPYKDGKVYPAPYGSYSRKDKKWVPFESFRDSGKQLQHSFSKAQTVTPEDFVDFVNDLYPDVPELDSDSAANQRRYQQIIRANWLITPDTRVEEDEGHVGADWSSRRIPPQQTVFIETPHNLSGYPDLQRFELKYGVSVPNYLLDKELRKKENSRITEEEIRLEKYEEDLKVYFTSDYSEELGLAFLYEDNFRPDATNQIDL